MQAVTEASFAPYGRILTGYPLDGALSALRAMPAASTPLYQRHLEQLYFAPQGEAWGDMFFGGMPWQMGCFTGCKKQLDEMEFHRSSELLCGAEDFILFAALPGEMEHGVLNTQKVRAFFVPAGTLIELYAGVWHAMPCAPGDAPIRVMLVLPYATGSAHRTNEQANFIDRTLWARNVWLIAHNESPLSAQGAITALVGENLRVE